MMNLNVTNYTSRINTQAIDAKAVKDLTSQILDSKDTQTVNLDNLNLSKFNRVDLGLDLYSARTNAEKATQVAIRNAGLDVSLNQNFVANVQYLNAQAAQGIHQTTKDAENKITLPVNEDNKANLREVFALPKSAQVFESQNLNKDKRGSNPFSYQRPANEEESQNVEPLNIFA